MGRYISSQKKERKDILQRTVLAMLATGMIAWPSFSPVYAASDYTRLDNGTNVTNGNVTDIYVGKVSGSNGVNVFKKFTVETGDIANMRFNQKDQNVHVNNLLNMVQERISVSGTVNALRNGKIGGNLYFISPNGMVVNSGGAINTGSLTVMTPTMDFFNYIRKEMKEVAKEGGGTEQKEVDVTYNIFTNEFKWKKSATETGTGTNSGDTVSWLAKSGTGTDAKTFGELWLAGTMNGEAVSDTNLTRENMMVKATVPLNASGSIMINGVVRASTGVNLQAANIAVGIGEDGTTTYADTEIKTGVDFSSIVNVDGLSGAQGGDSMLTATKDGEGNLVLTDASGLTGNGTIEITAKADDLNKSSGSIATYLAYDPTDGLGKSLLQKIFGVTANDTASASITLAAGKITSLGDVNMTAEATMEQQAAKDSFRSLFANTEATISLLGGEVKADGDVNMSATSTSSFKAEEAMGLVDFLTTNDTYWGAIANKISAIIKKKRGESDSSDQITTAEKVKEFFNAIQVGFAFVTSNANITVGDGVTVTAEGGISAAANASAVADMSYATGPAAIVKERSNNDRENNDGSQDSDSGNAPPSYQPPFNTRMVWENVENKAVVEIQGKLTAGDDGAIKLTADAANDTTIKTAINAPDGNTSSNYFNLAFNLLTQYNDAQVIVGRPAGITSGGTSLPENVGEIIKGGSLDIQANTTYSTNIQAIVLQDERAVSSTAFNWLDLDSKAVADIYGDITVDGTLGIAATNTAKKLYITSNNAMGKDEMEAQGLLRNIGAKIKETTAGTQVTGFINDIFTKVKGDAESEIEPMKTQGYEMQGKNGGADNNWSKNIALGSAVAVLDVDNRADVNIHEKSQLVSGDDLTYKDEKTQKNVTVHGLTLNASSVIQDTFIKARSSLLNIDSAKVAASGAAGVILLNNNSNITLYAGTTTDGEYASLKTAGTMDIKSYSAYEWARYTVMKNNVEKEAKATKEMLVNYKKLVETAFKDIKDKVNNIDLGSFDDIQLPDLDVPEDADFDTLKLFSEQLKNITNQLKTKIENLKTQLDNLLNGIKADIGTMTEGIKKNTANLEVQIGRLYTVSEQFIDAANYAQIQANSCVNVKNGSDSVAASLTASGSVLVQNMRNSAAVVIGKNAKLEAAKDMNIAAQNKQISVALDGKFKLVPSFDDVSGGKVGLGGSVSVDINHASATVMVAEGVTLDAKGNLTVEADNNLNNVAVVLGGGKSKTTSVTGMASYMGGDSNSLVSIDDEAKVITLKKLTVDAANTSVFTSVVGDISASQGGVMGASVGIINYNTNALALISDNDSDKDGSDKDAEEDLVADYGNMLKVALGKNAAGNDVYTVQSGTKANAVAGSFEALSLTMDALTDGVSNNVTVAGSSAGAGGSGDGHGMGNNESTNPARENSNDSSAPSQGTNEQPKAVIAGAGSVSWNKIKGSTAALLDVGITLNPKAQDGGIINISALDKSFIGAYSGAAAITKGTSSSKFNLTLEGAAAYNDIQKKTRSEIYQAELKGVNTLDNKATNTGAQVAAGLALGLETGTRSEGAGVALGASGSLNFVDSAPQAVLKNVTVKDNSSNTSVNNIAYDKDVQVAGGLTVEFTKSNVGIGAAFSLNQVNNDVLALVEGGQYNVKSFANYANSKLTQIGSALSMGLNAGKSWSVNVSGAVAVDNITNHVQANVVGSNIYTITFDGEARDGNLLSDSTTNAYIATLAGKGFDLGGQDAVRMINDGGKTMNVQDTATADDSANVTYTANTYKTDNTGNKQISVAVMLDAKIKSGSSGITINPGASVVRGKIDNDFTVTVDKSSIVAKNVTDALKLASESDTLQISVAAGVSAAPSGNGADIAGSVVMQKMENDTKVTVKDSSLTADDTAITSETKSTMIGVAGAGASGGNAAVGFTWAQNDIANVTGVYAYGMELQSYKSGVGADLTMTSTNKSTLVSVAAVTAVSLSGSSGTYSGSANGAVAFNHGTNDTEAIVDASTDGAVTRKSTLKKVGKVTIKAEDNNSKATVAGGVGVTTSVIGAGGHYAESTIGASNKYQSTKAAINNTNITTLDANSKIALNALDNTTLTTVAAGVGVSVNTGTTLSIGYLDGNVVNNKSYKKVEASMTATTLDINDVPVGERGSEQGALTLEATNKMKLTGSADGTNISVGGYVAGGVGVATNYSYVDTIAGIYGKDPQVKAELNATKISVKADAKNEILNVGISASGAGSASKVVNITGAANAATNKLNNKTKAEITNAKIATTKSVSVTAESLAKLTNIVGAASVAAGAGAGVRGALGTTVSLNDLYDDTLARVSDSNITAEGENDNGTKKGLYISAKGTHNLKNIAVTAGVAVQAGAGAAVSAGADVINDNIAGSTKALLERTDTNQGITAGLKDTQNVDVLADDSITLNSTAVTAQVAVTVGAGGSVGMGAGVSTEKITRTTSANITGMNDLRRANINAYDVNVKAMNTNQDVRLRNYVAALSVSIAYPVSIGLSATSGVGTIELKGTTKAGIDYANIYDVNTNVLADHRDYTDLTGVAASLSASIFGGAVGVNVYSLTNNVNTSAEIKNSKILHKDDGTATDTVKAYNKSTMRNTEVAAAAASLISVGVTVINNTFTENARAALVDTVIGEDNKRAKNVTVGAENEVDMKHIGVTANVGAAAVGVTNVHNTLNTGTVSEISGGTAYSGDITVNSKETRKIDDTVVGGTLGGVAVNVTKTYNNIGASLQDSYAVEGGGSASTTDMQEYIANAYRVQNTILADVHDSSKWNGTDKLYDPNEITLADMQGTETKVYKAPVVYTSQVRGANAIVNSKAVLNATGTINIGTNVSNIADAQITAGGLAAVKVGVMQNHLGLQDCSNVTISGATITGDAIKIGNDVTGNLRASTVDAGGAAVGVGVTQTDVQRSGGITITLQDSSITATSTTAAETIYVGNTNNVSLYGNVTNVTGGAVAGSALKTVVTDNSRAEIKLVGSATTGDYTNMLKGKDIVLMNSVTPQILAKITGVAAGAVTGGGSRARAEEKNTAYFSIERTNINADNFSVGNTVADVNKEGTEVDSVAADVHATSIGAVGVSINKSITTADITANATLYNVRYGGFSENAKTNVNVINMASSRVNNDIRGLTIGAIAVGSNICENTNTSKANTYITLDDGEDTEVASFNVVSATMDRGKLKTNGDGGGIIGVSPLAAEIVNNVNDTGTLLVTGSNKVLKATGDVSMAAKHGDDLTVNGNAIQCNLIGGSGTRINNDITFSDSTTLENVKIDAGGNVCVGAESQSDLNKNNSRVLETGGGGGFTGATSHANNHLTANNLVTLKNSNILSDKNILVGGYTDGVYYFDTYCRNAGLAGGNTAFMTNDWKITDKVQTTGTTHLETRVEGGDVIFVARENMNGSARNYVEMTAGIAGGTNSELTSNITRTNSINIGDYTSISSKRDINFLSGKDENGKLGELALQLQSQVYCGCVMDFSSTPKLKSNITQNNNIYLAQNTESVATRHVNLYADAGRESLYEHTGAYKMIGKSSAKSSYVSTTAGGLDGKINRDNYVSVDGSVTAGRDNIYKIDIGQWTDSGLGNAIVVPHEYNSMVQSSDNGNLTIYDMDNLADYIRVTVGESTVALTTEQLKQLGIKVGIVDLAQATTGRLDELNTLIANYNSASGDANLYNQLVAERARLQALMDSQKNASVTQAAYVEIPDMVASGGNVVVDTEVFMGNGTGKIKARGNAEISITNKTNLLLVTNDITVDEPGGELIYNGVRISGDDTAARTAEIISRNKNNHSANFSEIAISAGTTADINIVSDFSVSAVRTNGIRYAGDVTNNVPTDVTPSNALYMDGNGNYTQADGTIIMGYDASQGGKFVVHKDAANAAHPEITPALTADLVYETSQTTEINAAINKYGVKVGSTTTEHYEGYLPVKADIYITGNVNSLNGNVSVKNTQDSITIEGKSVKDAVSVKGKVVTISAPNGNITQGYTDGIVNIGGDVQKQYADFYSNAVTKLESTISGHTSSSGKLITTTIGDGEKAENSGGWLAGGQVYINASDININGNIQSGYGTYVADITEWDEYAIDTVITNWKKDGSKTLSDSVVMGNASYRVVEGGAYWSSADQCFQYHMDVYYNPSTGKLLVPDVDATGGRISLFGRILSTGSGKIMCLDGAYNINVNNALNYDIQLGNLIVNDTEGVVSIMNSGSGVMTEIRRSGVTVKNIKEGTTVSQDSHIAKNNDGTYTYTPDAGLAYGWVTGYSSTFYTRYYREFMSKWWGAAAYKEQDAGTLDSWRDGAVNQGTFNIGKEGRPEGAFIVTGVTGFSDKVGVSVAHTTQVVGSQTVQEGAPRQWSTGYLGCHKWLGYTWRTETATKQSNTAYVNASNPISIRFIGTTAENAVVDITSTGSENKKIILGGSIGNREIYTDTGNTEKGTVKISSSNGSIVQAGGNLYGANIVLSAKTGIDDVSVVAGDVVNLDARSTGTGSVDVTVTAARSAEGNVNLGTFGGRSAEVVTLNVAKNINYKASAFGGVGEVAGNRIDIVATNGYVGTAANNIIVHGGQQATGTSTLTASVNVDANGDIYLAQQQGDLRVGKIYSRSGDLTITVNNGGIVDALPYEESVGQSTDAQIEEWTKLGFFDDQSKAEKTANLQAVRAKLIEERDGTSATRKAEINAELNALAEKKNVEEQRYNAQIASLDAVINDSGASDQAKSNAEATKENLTFYWNKYQQDYNAQKTKLEQERDYAGATAERKEEINKQLESMPTTYEGWNKDKLLYAISDKIINPTAGVKSSNKDPNLYGKNITLRVKNNAGLNDPNPQVINLDTLGEVDAKGNVIHLNELKALSQADVATVTWDAKNGTATINKKLAIGLRQDGDGKLTVTGVTDDSKVNNYVYLEGRKFHDSTMSSWGQDNITLTKLAAAGDVRLFSLGAILNAASGSISDVISAHNLIISVGDESSTEGFSIGSSDNYMSFNITGSLGALATGNVYLKSSGDLVVANISAGGQNVSVGDKGNIYLKSENGSIYGMVEPNQPLQGYIRSESGGTISLEAENGSIGSVTDNSKVIRIKNVDSATPNANTLKFKAGKDIGVEGVSTAAASQLQDPDGILRIAADGITLTGTGTHKVSFAVNGTLQLAGNVDVGMTAGSTLTLKANKLDFVSGTVRAETINLQSVTSLEQAAASQIIGKNVNLTAGILLDAFTYGTTMVVDTKDLANARVVQKYENKADIQDDEIKRYAGPNASLQAENLKVISNANIDLGSQANKIHNITADAQKSIEIGTGSLGNTTDEVTATVTNSKNGGVVDGDIRFMVYNTDHDYKSNFVGKGSFAATGDIMFYDEAGALQLPKDGGTISSDSMVVLMANSDISAAKPIYAAKGLGIIAVKDITSLPEFMVVGQGLYVESLRGNIMANYTDFNGRFGSNDGSGNITYVEGSIKMIAEEGSINMPASGAIYARDDVELRAKKSITNGQGIYSQNGDIMIYTLGTAGDEGLIKNNNALITENGFVLLYGNKGVENYASIVAKSVEEGNAEYRDDAGIVTILSNTKIENTKDDDADREVILADKGVYLVAGSGGVTNSADIEVKKGDVVLYGIGKYKGEGWELLQGSGGSLNNSGNIFTSEGNIDISSDDALTNTGNIYTLQGDVDLTAVNDISTTGNVVALEHITSRGEGNVTIVSETGNISYKMNEDNSANAINIAGIGQVAVSKGVLTMVAAADATDKGKITVESSLAAGRGITIVADKDVAVASTYGMTATDGDISITSEQGHLDLAGDITASGTGDVLLTGMGYITTKGAITVAKGDFVADVSAFEGESLTADQKGYIKINKVDGDDKLIVTDGEVFLTADDAITVDTSVSAKNGFTAYAGDDFTVSGSVNVSAGDIDVTAGGDITTGGEITAETNAVYLVAGGNITNNSTVKSGTKDIVMVALDGDVTNKGSIIATQGNVMIGANSEDSAKGNITNGETTGDTNNITAGQDVILGASGIVTNNHNIYAGIRPTEYLNNDSTKDVIYQQHGDVVLGTVAIEVQANRYAYQESKGLTNTGKIVTYEGDIDMVVSGILTNSGTIHIEKQTDKDNGHGNVTLVAGGDISLSGTGVTVEVKGNITMLSGGTLDISTGAITTGEGNVTITSGGNLTNSANIKAGTDNTSADNLDKDGRVVLATIGEDGGDITNSGSIEATGSILIAGDNVTNKNVMTSVNDSIYIYATKNLKNANISDNSYEENNVDITAGKSVFISAEEDILNTGDITAQTGVTIGRGQVQVNGQNYTVDDAENLLDYGTITTVKGDVNLSVAQDLINYGSIKSSDGNILLEGDKTLNNVDSKGVILAENGNVTMIAGSINGDVTNDDILTNKGSLAAKGDIVMLALNGGLNNTSTLTANGVVASEGAAITEGLLVMMSAGKLTNNQNLISDGDIIVEASDDISNSSYVVASVSGDVEFSSADGSVTVASDIYSMNGNVLIEAGGAEDGHKGVSITGDIYADGGDLQVYAAHGNIVNSNESGNAWGKDGVDEAKGSITLAAVDGGILNKNSMKAQGDITLLSKTGIIIGGGDGSIQSIESTVSGDITIHVTGEVDGADSTINTKNGSSVSVNGGFFYNEASLTTNNGNVLIMANGYAKKDLETAAGDDKFDVSAIEGDIKLSVYNANTADIDVKGGNVLIAGGYGIANQGDIEVLKARMGSAPDEIKLQEGGDLAIYSENGDIFLYDLPNNDGITEHRNLLEAEGNMLYYAPNGNLYNNKDMHAVDGDIILEFGGDMATFNNAIVADNGNIKINAGGGAAVKALISAEQGAVEMQAGKDMVIYKEDGAGADIIIIAKENVTLLAGGGVKMEGNIISTDSDVVIGASNDPAATILGNGLEITGKISAENGLAALGSQKGDMVLAGTITGKKITAYTEDKDAETYADGEIYVKDELVLAGNHFGTGSEHRLDMTKVHGDYVLSLFGAGRTVSGDYVLDYGSDTTAAHLNQVGVNSLVVLAEGPVKIENISVSERADIYSMGTKTGIYGKMQPYDAEAEVAYYEPGRGPRMIDLHDMFFETTAAKSKEISEVFAKDTESFVTGTNGTSASGKGMSLDVISPTLQRGNGILLKDYFGYNVLNNRFSAVELSAYLDDMKPYVQFNNYFNIGMDFFERYDIIEIPAVTVNSITLNNTIKDNGIIVVRNDKEDDEYDF